MKTKKQTAAKRKSLAHHTIHHTKRIVRITPMFVHGMIIGAAVGVGVVVSLRATVATALSISSPRDCDTNAVVTCGTLSTDEIKQHYGDKGVADIYKGVGITAKDIGNIGKTAVTGTVFKNGDVAINGTVVAKNAITGGREYIKGSTKVVSGSATFYTRPPSVSFRPTSLPAFVVMEKGQFKFAILAACGNFVTATPVPKAAPPTPAPTPPVETPTITTPISTQTPPSQVVAQTASVTTVAELPQTGPGAVVIIALLSVIGGYLFHATHRHVRRKRRLRHTT